MGRSRRRRINDRRRAFEQREIAAEALLKAREVEKTRLGRGIKSVFRPHAGETIMGNGERVYGVLEDGSLERLKKEGAS